MSESHTCCFFFSCEYFTTVGTILYHTVCSIGTQNNPCSLVKPTVKSYLYRTADFVNLYTGLCCRFSNNANEFLYPRLLCLRIRANNHFSFSKCCLYVWQLASYGLIWHLICLDAQGTLKIVSLCIPVPHNGISI